MDPGEGGDTDPETGTYTYYEGTEVTVEAISEFGWQFDYWEGDCDYEVGNECTVGMDGDKSVTAHFEEDENGISECEAMGYECVPSGYCLGQTLVYECPSNQECCDEDPGIIP